MIFAPVSSMSRLARGLLGLVALAGAACASTQTAGGGDAATSPDAPTPTVALPDASAGDGGKGGTWDAATLDWSATTIEGTVALPDGTPVDRSTLVVTALGGDASVGTDGSFRVAGAGRGRQLVRVQTSGGSLVLTGFLKPGEPASLSTKTAANYLLFLAVGGAYLPPTAWESALEKLGASQEAEALRVFLDGQLTQQPSFLELATDRDRAALSAALASGLRSLLPTLAAPPSQLVLVNPADERSGIRVLVGDKDGASNADVNQITLMHRFRRRAHAFIEREVNGTYFREADFEVPPTTGFNGALGTISDWAYGNIAYAPIYYGPIGLGTSPEESEPRTYRVRVVGNGWPTSIQLSAEQQRQKTQVGIKSVLADFFMPAVCSFMNFDGVGKVFDSPAFAEFVKEMVNQTYNGALIEFGKAVETGDVLGAASKLSTVLANNAAVRDYFLETFRIYVLIKLFDSESAWRFSLAASKSLLVALDVVDKAMAAADLAAIAKDTAASASVEDWAVTVRAPKVLLSPGRTELGCGERIGLTASVRNGGQAIDSNLIYAFENTAAYGDLVTDVNSTYKNQFEQTKPHVRYEVRPGATASGGTDRVSVKVFMLVDDATGKKSVRQELGTTSSTIAVGKDCVHSSGYLGSTAFTSGCTYTLTAPTVVHPGDEVTVTARAGFGGVCGTASVWMSYAVSATLDGKPATGASSPIYDFCYGGGPQPIVPGGVGVSLPDGETHTIKFKIDPTITCSVCVREDPNGGACSGNPGNRQTVTGPAVVMNGTGGTHGWSTVRFFGLEVPK